MRFPERFSNLPEYAFPRLRALLDHHPAGGDVVHMTIGEPKHPMPSFLADILNTHIDEFSKYPPNEGAPELRKAIREWINFRYGVTVSCDQVMALNGTREGLFNALLALCPETKNGRTPKVLMPNPFYQVYAVAAAAMGAEPVFVAASEDSNFLPDFAGLSEDILNDTAVVYLCSPSNPQGAIASCEYLAKLIKLAEKYDFKIFADECYSEIYRDAAPAGAMQAANKVGADKERVVIFHSLSKRSNMPGLRSGFVASGPANIKELRQLRNYAGAPVPLPLQRVATKAWQDEDHVIASRKLYQEKYKIADEVFGGIDGYTPPEAGFFLWLPVKDGEQAALDLWTKTGVRVLPGAYLSRDTDQGNPGTGFIRVAMVAPAEEMHRGLTAIARTIY